MTNDQCLPIKKGSIMKNFYPLIFTLLFIQITTHSQSCLPEGITFTTQEEIDNFQTNYPGCNEIEGDVFIESLSGAEITNLNGLSALTAIYGDTWIQFNDELTSLEGLNNLTSVGGNFKIFINENLESISALVNLNSIPGDLEIAYHKLANLSGLDNITFIDGNFRIC